ncbi:MAG: hypothetical protein ABI670_00725 [Chloroflexota bacterium]
MRQEPISIAGRSSLTRISVSGGGNQYVVRNGTESPVRVWVRGDTLECECGKRHCSHIASLEMCGFVDPDYVERRAA